MKKIRIIPITINSILYVNPVTDWGIACIVYTVHVICAAAAEPKPALHVSATENAVSAVAMDIITAVSAVLSGRGNAVAVAVWDVAEPAAVQVGRAAAYVTAAGSAAIAAADTHVIIAAERDI